MINVLIDFKMMIVYLFFFLSFVILRSSKQNSIINVKSNLFMDLVDTLEIKSKNFPVLTYNQRIFFFYYDSIMIRRNL